MKALCRIGLCLKPRVGLSGVRCISFNGPIRKLEWGHSWRSFSLLSALTFMFRIDTNDYREYFVGQWIRCGWIVVSNDNPDDAVLLCSLIRHWSTSTWNFHVVNWNFHVVNRCFASSASFSRSGFIKNAERSLSTIISRALQSMSFQRWRSFSGQRVLLESSWSAAAIARYDPPSARDEPLRTPRADTPAATSAPQVRLAGEWDARRSGASPTLRDPSSKINTLTYWSIN